MHEPKRTIIYWILQIGGWGAITMFLLGMMFVFSEEVPPKGIWLQLVIGGSCLLSSHLYRLYIKKFKWVDFSIVQLLPRIFIGSLITAIFAQVLVHTSMLTFLNWESVRPIVWKEFPVYVINVFVFFIGWSIFYFGFHFSERARKSKMDALKAESALKDAELIALKSQINPHFLFNSLNNIKALILEKPMKAREAISNLSDLLRYSVKFSNKSKVDLESEIDVVKNYLQLESFQYDDRLEFTLSINKQTLDKMIPPMIIQLLVENAVKHGISQLPAGGKIRISTNLEDDNLIIEVENSGSIKDNSSGGIGIQNALDRIRLLYNVEPIFQLSEMKGMVKASLQLPAIS